LFFENGLLKGFGTSSLFASLDPIGFESFPEGALLLKAKLF